MPRNTKVTINNKEYNSIVEATKALDLNYGRTRKHFYTNKELTITEENKDYFHGSRKKLRIGSSMPQSWLDRIEPGKKCTFGEVSKIFYELGITPSVTTKSNIQQLEKKALQNLRKVLEEDKDVLIYLNLL